ncbi:hypothetical protein RKD37_005860 [Streptomyces ambofaciens]
MVSAVAVPSEPKRSGTTTNSVEAGVTHDSVRSVPPTTPMERLSVLDSGGAGTSGGAAAVSAGRSVSVMERFRSTRAAWFARERYRLRRLGRTSFCFAPEPDGIPTKTAASMGVYLRKPLIATVRTSGNGNMPLDATGPWGVREP